MHFLIYLFVCCFCLQLSQFYASERRQFAPAEINLPDIFNCYLHYFYQLQPFLKPQRDTVDDHLQRDFLLAYSIHAAISKFYGPQFFKKVKQIALILEQAYELGDGTICRNLNPEISCLEEPTYQYFLYPCVKTALSYLSHCKMNACTAAIHVYLQTEFESLNPADIILQDNRILIDTIYIQIQDFTLHIASRLSYSPRSEFYKRLGLTYTKLYDNGPLKYFAIESFEILRRWEDRGLDLEKYCHRQEYLVRFIEELQQILVDKQYNRSTPMIFLRTVLCTELTRLLSKILKNLNFLYFRSASQVAKLGAYRRGILFVKMFEL
jgi:hypothetical protein